MDKSKPLRASWRVMVRFVKRSLFRRSKYRCLNRLWCVNNEVRSITFVREWWTSDRLGHHRYAGLLERFFLQSHVSSPGEPSKRNGISSPSWTPVSTSTSRTFSSVTNLPVSGNETIEMIQWRNLLDVWAFVTHVFLIHLKLTSKGTVNWRSLTRIYLSSAHWNRPHFAATITFAWTRRLFRDGFRSHYLHRDYRGSIRSPSISYFNESSAVDFFQCHG